MIGPKTLTVAEVVHVLNQLLEINRASITRLINYREPCNEALANHPTVQVHTTEFEDGALKGGKVYSVGLLGILNGLFGVDDSGSGFIAGEFDDETGDLLGLIERGLEVRAQDALESQIADDVRRLVEQKHDCQLPDHWKGDIEGAIDIMVRSLEERLELKAHWDDQPEGKFTLNGKEHEFVYGLAITYETVCEMAGYKGRQATVTWSEETASGTLTREDKPLRLRDGIIFDCVMTDKV